MLNSKCVLYHCIYFFHFLKFSIISDILSQLKSTYLSRKESKLFALSLLDDPRKVEKLMSYFFSKDLRICQMASFPLITIADHDINLLTPYLSKMVSHYRQSPHDAYRRNALRSFQFMELPEDLEGDIYELCFEEFCNTKLPTAIRAFALTTMCNICVKYPELLHEVLPTLYDYKNTGTVGFENRLKREIQRIKKLVTKS